MPKGVKIEDVIVGTGEPVLKGMRVVANLRIFLSRGDEVTAEYPDSPRITIDLSRRDTIAGVRYGIEGMRVGGRRKLVISPHLAYGEEGIGEYIPPNAVLHCDVELLQVLQPGEHSEPLPGRRLDVFLPGEAATATPRVQFGLHENGRCGAFITSPVPGYGWRPARGRSIEFHPDPGTINALIDEALAMPGLFPDDCLSNDVLWADSSEPANSVTRDQRTGAACVTISVTEADHTHCCYSMKMNAPTWLASQLHRKLSAWLRSGDEAAAG